MVPWASSLLFVVMTDFLSLAKNHHHDPHSLLAGGKEAHQHRGTHHRLDGSASEGVAGWVSGDGVVGCDGCGRGEWGR